MTDTTSPTFGTGSRDATACGFVGDSARRPDGSLKVQGAFAYSSDLHHEQMLWGATLRSPHPAARIRSLDTSRAEALPGVAAVLTHRDVPGRATYGMKVPDQPVLAADEVRYQGEPVAVVAADHPETARRALGLIAVDYQVSQPLTDPERALALGNTVRHVRIRHGDVPAAEQRAAVVVRGEYQVGTQDQAFLGPESGLAIPHEDGGVHLYVSSQWIHDDQHQVAASLGLETERVRITLAGVGGAFGGREDISVHIHACLLASHTGRPVKMVYGREESFFGHVHRHPAWMRYEHGATRDGRLVYVTARLLLDGGAYTSTSPVVIANASYFAAGAYQVPNVRVDGFAVYTNNPPCGAMRGFGAVQSCYGVESNMDKLAHALLLDPAELRLRNAMTTGTVLPTGQAVHGPAPVAELVSRLRDRPLPPRPASGEAFALPGGLNNSSRGEGIRRGIGYAVGVKAIGFSGGVDDTSSAHVRLECASGEPVVSVHTAAAECGQGIVTVQEQIARSELGVRRVVVLPADTTAADAGSSSASRQTWMSGGAVQGACRRIRDELLRRAGRRPELAGRHLALRGGALRDTGTGEELLALADLLGTPVQANYLYRHRPTQAIDPDTGQGHAHVAFAFAAHRAVVDVDVDLGLVKVVEMATAQDVGKAMNPQAVRGQIEGGTAQGLGLALLEELRISDGTVRNPSFTDYLIPTIADMPEVPIDLLENPHPDAPYGLNGVGEPPTLSSTPALANAVRDATGRALPRVPVHPDELVGITGTEHGTDPTHGRDDA